MFGLRERKKPTTLHWRVAKKKGENGIRANTGLALSGDQVFPWVLEILCER